MSDNHDRSLDHLIYDGCGGAVRGENGEQRGSVRPSGYHGELPPLTPERIDDCTRVLNILNGMLDVNLTPEQREWRDFVQEKYDDWKSDWDGMIHANEGY